MKNQSFTDWEWCVVDDRSTHKYVQTILQRAMAGDSRIRVALRSTNGGIVDASQDGLDMATGEFVGLLDHDDTLDPEALAKVAATLLANPDADYVYTDEDKINSDGQHYDSFRKPPFDQSRLRGQNYCCHFRYFETRFWMILAAFGVDLTDHRTTTSFCAPQNGLAQLSIFQKSCITGELCQVRQLVIQRPNHMHTKLDCEQLSNTLSALE